MSETATGATEEPEKPRLVPVVTGYDWLDRPIVRMVPEATADQWDEQRWRSEPNPH